MVEEESLAARLKELDAFLVHSHGGGGVDETLVHLQDDITESMLASRARARRCTGLLLGHSRSKQHDPPSLIAFLDACGIVDDDARKKEMREASGSALGVLAFFVETFGGNQAVTKDQVAAIFRCCRSTARADPSNKVKAQALAVIVHVLKNCRHLLAAEDFAPQEYAEKLFYDLKFGKATQTAKGNMLEVIGCLIEAFPRELQAVSAANISWIEDALDQHFSVQDPQLLVIRGLLFVLARLITYEPNRYDTDADKRRKIYSYLNSTLAATVNGNLSRYQITSVALQFVAEHGRIFRDEIGSTALTWFSFMKFCCASDNKTVKEHAPRCSTTVLRVINQYLLDNKEDEASKRGLHRMLKEMLPCISNGGVDSHDAGFAIHGMSCLAPAAQVFLGRNGLLKIEEKLKLYGETMLTMNVKQTAYAWSLFSKYLKCIGVFIGEIYTTPIDDAYAMFLGDLFCHVMDAYPYCMWRSKASIYKSFLGVLHAVSKTTVVDALVDRVVYHTLLLSLSDISSSTDQVTLYHPETGVLVTKLVYSYEEVWVMLLGREKDDQAKSVLIGDRRDAMAKPAFDSKQGSTWVQMRGKLFDALARNIIRIMMQLDLSYTFELHMTAASGDYGGFKPVVPRDQSIMVNLAEFVERLFLKTTNANVLSWIPMFMRTIIAGASERPLVSSYYRIGAVLVEVLERDGHSQSRKARSKPGDTADDVRANHGFEELMPAYGHFVEATCAQLRFYQDELLVACAKFVLATPASLLSANAMTTSLRAILSLGISYLPAADTGLSALEKWQSQDAEQLSAIMTDVVPLLAPYFNQINTPEESKVSTLSAVKTGLLDEDQASEYVRLQGRVMTFLGSVGGAASILMSQPPRTLRSQFGRAAMSTQELFLPCALNDVSIELAMDSMMMQLGTLALETTDRRVKTSASEAFHALVSFLCGKTATQPHTTGEKTVYFDTWKMAFGLVLQLSTDSDKISRGLFEPLLFQLLRWFSRNSGAYPFEYSNIIDHLTGGLSSMDSAIRAMSSKCLASVLSTGSETSSERQRAIFERLFSLCHHPSAIQRSGSAMTIAYFLRSMDRNSAQVASLWALDCMKNLLGSLRMAESSNLADTGGKAISQSMITKAIGQLERLVRDSSGLFHDGVTLEGRLSLPKFTIWLFQQIAKQEPSFRNVCQRLFCTFSPIVSGATCKHWIVDYTISKLEPTVNDIIAPVGLLASGLAPFEDEPQNSTIDWLEQFSASVEAFMWCWRMLDADALDILQVEESLTERGVHKRKAVDSSIAHPIHQQSTIAAAISAFLKLHWSRKRILGSQFERRNLKAFASALLSLLQLVLTALTSKDASLISMIQGNDKNAQRALAKKTLDALMNEESCSDPAVVYAVRKTVREIASASSEWKSAFVQHTEECVNDLRRALSGGAQLGKQDSSIADTCNLVYQLLEAEILDAKISAGWAETFYRAANEAFRQSQHLPQYYDSVFAALQAASACGWDITTMFSDESFRSHFGPMYSDILNIIVSLPIWRRCARQMIALSRTNAQVLSALMSVLTVASNGSTLKATTPEMDEFVLVFLQDVAGFADYIKDGQHDAQHGRMLLEALHFMLLLCQRCSDVVLKTSCVQPLSEVQASVTALLERRDTAYVAKADTLRLIAVVQSISTRVSCKTLETESVVDCLRSFAISEFPIVSTDVKRGSRDFDTFGVLFARFREVVEQSASVSFLRLLIPSLREGDRHLFFREIKESLERFCRAVRARHAASETSPADPSSSALVPVLIEVAHLLLDSQEGTSVRQLLLELVFTPLIELAPPDARKAFFMSPSAKEATSMIIWLTTIVSAPPETMALNPGAAIAFSMLEILFRLVDPDSVRGEINDVFLGHKNGKGREFTMLVCKCASKVAGQRIDTPTGEGRLLCCAAYNCLLTAVSQSQKQEKIFDQLLFQSAIWRNISDTSQHYRLTVETEQFHVTPLSKYSSSTLITSGVGAMRTGDKAVSRTTESNGPQTLDFFSCSSLSQTDPQLPGSVAASALDIGSEAYDGTQIEMDEINSHPCMVNFLRALFEMKSQFGDAWTPQEMPNWMKKLHEFIDQGADQFFRLFVVKAILNFPSLFACYSSTWLPTMLDVIVDAGLPSESEFHYLFRDVCHLAIDDWKEVGSVHRAASYDRFVNTLIGLSSHDSTAIRNDNITLVSQLTLLWKDIVKVDVGIVWDFLVADETENKRAGKVQRHTGIQLASTLISKGISLRSTENSLQPGRALADGVVMSMKDHDASVFSIAAEVGGLLLTQDVSSYSNDITAVILDAFTSEDFKRFLSLIRNISLHHPMILDAAMLNRLAFVLPKAVLIDSWALLAMETLEYGARVEDVAKGMFVHLRTGFGRFLHHRDERVSFVALRALSPLLDYMTQQNRELVCSTMSDGGMGLLEAYVHHGNPECRRLHYDVVQRLIQMNASPTLETRLRGGLLSGFFDFEPRIRDQVLTFCSSTSLLPSTCAMRLSELFESFFSADLADQWILYSTNLLLGLAESTESYRRPLIASSLTDGPFVDATIDTTWEQKHQSMAPLFSLQAEMMSVAKAASPLEQNPPATRGGRIGDGWGSVAQSQLILPSIDVGTGAPNLMSQTGNPRHQRVQRRFAKRTRVSTNPMQGRTNNKQDRRFFQEQAALDKIVLAANLNRQRKARGERVTMRRKYRIGEYPDIQISVSDVLSPLMALCSLHATTSRRVFGLLFAAILEKDTYFDSDANLNSLGASLTNSMAKAKMSGPFVGCVQHAYFETVAKNPDWISRLQLSSKVLGESSLASTNYYSGELVLEELLMNRGGPEDKQASIDSDGVVAERWDQLHKIVSAIQKHNFLLAIASKCSAITDSRLALEARLSGNLPIAIASYDKAHNILSSQMEIVGDTYSVAAQLDARRCLWEKLDCLETLNSWTKLDREIREHEAREENFVWNEESPYLEKGVGYKLRSCLGLKEQAENSDSAIMERLQVFVEDAISDSSKAQVLRSKFPVELTLAWMKLEDENQSRAMVEGFYSSFIQRWQGTSPLATTPRLELMQMLSSMVQIDEVLTLTGNIARNQSEYTTEDVDSQYLALVNKWLKSSPPTAGGSIAVWSQYYLVQDITADYIWENGHDMGLLSDEVHSSFLQAKSSVMLEYANAALSSDIMALTSRYLKEYRELCNASNLPKVSLKMVDVFVSHVLKLADRQLHTQALSGESVKMIVKYFQTATKLFDNTDVLDLMETVSNEERSVMCCLEARTFGKASEFYITASLDSATAEEYLARAFDVFQHSTTFRAQVQQDASDAVARTDRARLAFIEFLSRLLAMKGSSILDGVVERKKIIEHLVHNVLEGMICGNQECATYFPQLCDLVAPFPDVAEKFERTVLDRVPLWTCLQWAAQLMALLNGSIGATILAILEKLAEQFPTALFYDFKVTCGSASSFKLDLTRLKARIANSTMEKFVDALRMIHHPEIRLKEGLRDVAKLLNDNRLDDARARLAQVWQDCFSLERATVGVRIGRYNRDWARKSVRGIERILGKNGSNLTAKTIASARDWITKNFSVFPGKFGITRDMKARLGDFAEWLEEFDPVKDRLELPGQYTLHWGKPDPSSHVRILSFDLLLGVLASKQLPKRLTLRCSDEKEYTFLVKGGEDLRLDQRIEQLFGVMNQVLRVDPRCRDRGLSTRTYSVIPMTQEIGLIEWLSGTSTLKSVIEAQLQKDDRCTHLTSNKRQKLELFNTTAAKSYESFLLKQRGSTFGAKVIAPTSREVIKTFAQVQAEVPGDLLRRQLFRLGSDYDEFLSIRDRFLASLAVFNACSYILGIGDRHLDNFLLDLSDGRVIGIDFGVSFGAGASLLPVPELIPFRYTRQMDVVLQPYDGTNLMAQEMQQVFDALRAKKQVIESVLNVFLHEPLMDWQQTTTTFQAEIFAQAEGVSSQSGNETEPMEEDTQPDSPAPPRRGRTDRGSESLSLSAESKKAASSAWLPDVKIAIARRKLEGFAPQPLLKEELAQNANLSTQLAKFHALVDAVGGQGGNDGDALAVGAGGPTGLTAFAQAQELLAMATSPDILGRTYFGWMPWL